MTNKANIVLDDAQPTPVAHTFAPSRSGNDMEQWEDRSASQYIGFNKLTLQITRPTGNTNSAGSRNLRLTLRIETPKLETISNSTVTGIAPAPTVAYRPMGELSFVFPERCIAQDRKDLRAMFLDLLADSQVVDFVENYALPA